MIDTRVGIAVTEANAGARVGSVVIDTRAGTEVTEANAGTWVGSAVIDVDVGVVTGLQAAATETNNANNNEFHNLRKTGLLFICCLPNQNCNKTKGQ